MNPVPWLQMTNMISYQELVRTFPKYKEISVGAIGLKSSLDKFMRPEPTPALNHPHFLIFLSKFIHEIHFATIFFLMPQKPTDRQALMLILSMMLDFSAKSPQISPP